MSAPGPIYFIPTEILQKIFAICCQRTRASATSFPIVLTLVCRLWQIVAESTPSLWSSPTIDIKVDGRQLVNKECAVDQNTEALKSKGAAIAKWLTRAAPGGQVRLTILGIQNVNMDGLTAAEREGIFKHVMSPILDAICSPDHTISWVAVRIGPKLDEPYRSMFHRIAARDLVALKSLWYTCNDNQNSSDGELSPFATVPFRESGFVAAPNLTAFSCHILLPTDRLRDLPFANSGRNLTDVTVGYGGHWRAPAMSDVMTAQDISPILVNAAHNLVNLDINFYWPFPDHAPWPVAEGEFRPTEYPKLRSLTVSNEFAGGGDTARTDFVGSIRAPRLRVMRFVEFPLAGGPEPMIAPTAPLRCAMVPFLRRNLNAVANFKYLTRAEFSYLHLSPVEFEMALGTLGGPGTAVATLVVSAGLTDGAWRAAVLPGGASFSKRLLERMTPRVGSTGDVVTANSDGGSDRPCLFPRLLQLTVRLGRNEDFIDADFVEFVKSRTSRIRGDLMRAAGFARLETATVDFYSPKTMDVAVELVSLENLRVTALYRTVTDG